MLHRILPVCQSELGWIVDLQRRLLVELCNQALTGNDVTESWVIAQLPDLDSHWVTSFCRRKDQIEKIERPLLAHMKALADLPPAGKQALLNAFNNDCAFQIGFTNNQTPPHQLQGLQPFAQGSARESIRGFFESFYAPNIYAAHGYPVPQANGQAANFHKDKFLKQYGVANPNILVCPMCDGDLGEPQVDHFYPKSHYPYLSCHPLNLVPICPTCNSRPNKGSKQPLTLNTPDPKADWLHPYLRSGHGQYQIELERLTEGTTPVLHSPNPQTQKQLDNLDRLVNLKPRWRKALQREFQSALRHIDSEKKKVGRSLTQAELCGKLQDWADSAQIDIGLRSFGLVGARYLQSAAACAPESFDELWVCNSGDSVLPTRVNP